MVGARRSALRRREGWGCGAPAEPTKGAIGPANAAERELCCHRRASPQPLVSKKKRDSVGDVHGGRGAPQEQGRGREGDLCGRSKNLANAEELSCEDSPDRREGVREHVPQFAHNSVNNSFGGARTPAQRRCDGKSPWCAVGARGRVVGVASECGGWIGALPNFRGRTTKNVVLPGVLVRLFCDNSYY